MHGRRSLQGLLVMRFLMVSNGVILAVIGGLYAAYGTRPAGYVIGAVLGVAALILWALVPLTDPYRSERRPYRPERRPPPPQRRR